MLIGKIGLVALAFAFLASGMMNLIRPGNTWKPPKDRPDQEPPKDMLRRTRWMGALWLCLGVLVAAYTVKVFLHGY